MDSQAFEEGAAAAVHLPPIGSVVSVLQGYASACTAAVRAQQRITSALDG